MDSMSLVLLVWLVMAALMVLWLSIHLCLRLCFCVYVVILHMCCIIVTQWGGPGGIEA